MPQFQVSTAHESYPVLVERGSLSRVREFVPERAGRLFVITTHDVWDLHGERLRDALAGHPFDTLFFAGGEENKRFSHIESLASQRNAAAGGGPLIAGNRFRRGHRYGHGWVPRRDFHARCTGHSRSHHAACTGRCVGRRQDGRQSCLDGKNLIGSFHQPLAVLVDPSVLTTLPEREYRAGLYEIVKSGVIRSERLFHLLEEEHEAVLAQEPRVVDEIIAESVRIKAEVVSVDERESDLRRILNFGHTFGHALEAETNYTSVLHGEAVSWGMRAATYLAGDLGMLSGADHAAILRLLDLYGPIPPLKGLSRGESPCSFAARQEDHSEANPLRAAGSHR